MQTVKFKSIWGIIMETNITLLNDEKLKVNISKGTYNYIKSKMDEKSIFNDYVKNIEVIK